MSSNEERNMAKMHEPCKIVEVDEGGKLKFDSSKLSMLLNSKNSEKPSDTPIVMIAVIGPPRSGKSFFTNLILRYLKKSGKIGWLDDLSKDALTGFEFGHGEDSVETSSYLSPDSNSSGIYAYPELLQVDDKGELYLLLHVHFISDASWKRDKDLFHYFLCMTCSLLVEIQETKDQYLSTTFLHQVKADASCNKFLCRSITFLQRGRISEADESDEKQTHVIAESFVRPPEKCLAEFSTREFKNIKAIFPVIFDRKWSAKSFNGKPVSSGSLGSFIKTCVELIDRINDMNNDNNGERKTYSGLKTPFQHKILSRRDLDTFRLEEENLIKIVGSMEQINESLVLTSVIPSEREDDEESMWKKLIIKALTPESVGVDTESSRCLPDENSSGIYMLPDKLELNNRLICFLQANYIKTDPMAGTDDSLQHLLRTFSSIIIELNCNDNKMCLITFKMSKLDMSEEEVVSAVVLAKPVRTDQAKIEQFKSNQPNLTVLTINEANACHDDGNLVELRKQFHSEFEKILDNERYSTLLKSLAPVELISYFSPVITHLGYNLEVDGEAAYTSQQKKPLPRPRPSVPKSGDAGNLTKPENQRNEDNERTLETNAAELLRLIYQDMAYNDVHKRLNAWIKQSLTIFNIGEIQYVYEKLYQDLQVKVERRAKSDPNSEMIKALPIFLNMYSKKMKEEILPIVTCLINVISDFQILIHKEFKKNICFPSAHLENIISTNLQNVMRGNSHASQEDMSFMITNAVNILAREYKNHNKSVQRKEVEIYEQCCQTLSEIYSKEYQTVSTSKLPQSSKYFDKIEANIKKEGAAFITQYAGIENNVIMDPKEQLKTSITRVKINLVEQNLDMLQRGQEHVKNSVRKCKQTYELNITGLVEGRKYGIQRNEFSRFERQFREESTLQLKKALRSLPWDESPEAHIATLLHRLTKTTNDFRQLNDNNLKESRVLDSSSYESIQAFHKPPQSPRRPPPPFRARGNEHQESEGTPLPTRSIEEPDKRPLRRQASVGEKEHNHSSNAGMDFIRGKIPGRDSKHKQADRRSVGVEFYKATKYEKALPPAESVKPQSLGETLEPNVKHTLEPEKPKQKYLDGSSASDENLHKLREKPPASTPVLAKETLKRSDFPMSILLIIQLETQYIGVSVVDNKTGKIIFPYAQESIPAAIGRRTDMKWVIGPDVQKATQAWPLLTCLIQPKGPWTENILIRKQETRITFEFLFGLFLILVRKKVERDFDGMVSDVVITVPIWISSRQRQQLKDSGRVAGFSYEKFNIINENFLLARSIFKSSKSHGSKFVVVIVENSGKIDITIHGVNPNDAHVTRALVHSGDYEPTNDSTVKHGRSAWERIWNQTLICLREWNKNHFFDPKTALFYIAWKTAHAATELQDVGNFIGAPLMQCQYFPPESLPERIASEASHLQKHKELGKSTDGIAYSISMDHGDSKWVIKKGETYGIDKQKVRNYYTSYSAVSSARFFEDSPHGKEEIGELKIPDKIMRGCESVKPFFDVTSDGVVQLASVEVIKKSKLFSPKTEKLDCGQYLWKCPNLSSEEITTFMSLGRMVSG